MLLTSFPARFVLISPGKPPYEVYATHVNDKGEPTLLSLHLMVSFDKTAYAHWFASSQRRVFPEAGMSSLLDYTASKGLNLGR